MIGAAGGGWRDSSSTSNSSSTQPPPSTDLTPSLSLPPSTARPITPTPPSTAPPLTNLLPACLPLLPPPSQTFMSDDRAILSSAMARRMSMPAPSAIDVMPLPTNADGRGWPSGPFDYIAVRYGGTYV